MKKWCVPRDVQWWVCAGSRWFCLSLQQHRENEGRAVEKVDDEMNYGWRLLVVEVRKKEGNEDKNPRLVSRGIVAEYRPLWKGYAAAQSQARRAGLDTSHEAGRAWSFAYCFHSDLHLQISLHTIISVSFTKANNKPLITSLVIRKCKLKPCWDSTRQHD